MRAAVALALLAALGAPAVPAGVPDPFAERAGAYWLELDGLPVAARAPDVPRPPASLTKMMTALVLLDFKPAPDQVIRVSVAAARETGMRLGLKAGEQLRFEDALAALVVQSANDACRALADALAGDQATFVTLMNTRARLMGLPRTRFANACGHDDAGQRSTARELALIARAAMAQPRYAALAERVAVTIRTLDSGRQFALSNQNQMIGRFDGAIGVKSGFTEGAGKCIVALAQRRGHRALLVLLDAQDRWWTAHKLLEHALGRAP